MFRRTLAAHILGEMTEDDLPVTVPQRFRGVREAYYEVGAQIAHLSSKI